MSSALQKLLALQGFCIFRMLHEDDILKLNSYCNTLFDNHKQEFVSSSHFLPYDESVRINNILHAILNKPFVEMFPYLQLLGGTLAAKYKSSSILKAHNDWSIVDESHYNSYNLWIPLVDTNKENGTLGLIPGSHLWKQNLRGLNIPGSFEKYTDKLMKTGYEPALQAGEVILYNHKLVHYSRPNTTAKPRHVAIIGAKDKDAELQVSFCLDGKNIETYKAQEEDFYVFDAELIKQRNRLINTQTILQTNVSWTEIEVEFKTNLPEMFLNLIPERQSFITKLLQKINL
ncbi:MAG TPA: phytanoyl-CoA dioxygenase family protein [Chitinophagales bacterium]|nr:phytanoyl-CoA dioxygenase family protein [Chitinophagales bacterium]